MADDPIWQALAPFFTANPASSYRREARHAVVEKPWGDPSLEIWVKEGADELIAALNALHLPPRHTAVWHTDTADLEIIWTLVSPSVDLRERKFDFWFGGRSYQCEFGDASERVLLIAGATAPTATRSRTDHRNLLTFRLYTFQRRQSSPQMPAVREVPTCFWIRDVRLSETELVELLRHLNFYMHYFDRSTPYILIHEQLEAAESERSRTRFPAGEFPATITSRRLDPYLLGLWQTLLRTQSEDPFLRFLYTYQVIEYAAFYHLQEETADLVKRILSSPDTPVRPEHATRQILDALSATRIGEEQKVVAVIKEFVEPVTVWSEIQHDLRLFSEEVVFDGGFALPALIREGWDLGDFERAWIPSFPDALRKIRNALVHSREPRLTGVIAPTLANYMRLRQWLPPIERTAEQIIVGLGS